MKADNTDVMARLIADHQDRLRAQSRKRSTHGPGTASQVRRAAGQTLIRLGEQIRGEIRDASHVPAQSRLATH